jgi:excisionase family DNA binding protein
MPDTEKQPEETATPAAQPESSILTPEQQQEIEEGKSYTIKQLATRLNYTTQWLTQLCQDGRIKAIKPFGGHWRIPKSIGDKLISQGIPPPPRKAPAKPSNTQTIVVPEKDVPRVQGKQKKEEDKDSEDKGILDFLFE